MIFFKFNNVKKNYTPPGTLSWRYLILTTFGLQQKKVFKGHLILTPKFQFLKKIENYTHIIHKNYITCFTFLFECQMIRINFDGSFRHKFIISLSPIESGICEQLNAEKQVFWEVIIIWRFIFAYRYLILTTLGFQKKRSFRGTLSWHHLLGFWKFFRQDKVPGV